MFNRRHIIFRPRSLMKTVNTLQARFKGDCPGSALPISLPFFFFCFSRMVYYPRRYDSVHWCSLTLGLDLFQPCFFFFLLSLPTGGWRRRRISGADRDIFPEQAHAKGCKEPAGRRCCPMSGIRSRTFSE